MNKIIKLSIWVVMYSQYYLYRLSVSHQLNKQKKKNKNESKNVKNKAIQEAQKAQKKNSSCAKKANAKSLLVAA